jgi:hypothetical protein
LDAIIADIISAVKAIITGNSGAVGLLDNVDSLIGNLVGTVSGVLGGLLGNGGLLGGILGR